MSMQDYLVGGKIDYIARPEETEIRKYRLTPLQTREAFAKAGAYNITYHAEVVPVNKRKELIKKIRELGCKASISINPDKELSLIKDVLDDVDMVLLMTVFPGFGGQKFILDVVPRIKELRRLKPSLDIDSIFIHYFKFRPYSINQSFC